MKYGFSDLIDVAAVQRLTDLFHTATGMASAVIDLDGIVLTGSGWQRLCTDFHRVNPETRQRCIESDTIIANQVAAGQKYTLYNCKNGLVDAATPIAIEGEHVANFFTGQFLLEPPHLQYFQEQAQQFGFDEGAYMNAVAKVPVIDERKLRPFLEYFSEFAQMLGEMGMRHARRIEAEEALRERDDWMKRAQEIAHLGGWELDLVSNRLSWSDEVYRIFGLQPQEFEATYEAFLKAVHPEDRAAVDAAYSGSLRDGKDTYEIEHRVMRKSTGEVCHVHEKCEHVRDATGRIVKSIGMVHDITKRKRAEEALRRAHDELEQRVQERTKDIVNTNKLLQLYTVQSSRSEYLDQVIKLLLEWTSCEGVGVRVLGRNGDIPYGAYVGFSKEFWESENFLSIHTDQCACIRVVTGKPEPQDTPFMTPRGSFHCEDTMQLLAALSDEEKKAFRGKCITTGYASVTIVPISHRGNVLGAIHLADRRKAKVPGKTVAFIESVQPLIGEAMQRFNLEEEQEKLQHQLLQAHKMEALGTATGGIAHDFNNILAAIIGFTELLHDRMPKDSREEQHLSRILTASLRGRDLIRQMLTFARKTEHEKKPVGLSTVIDETIKLLRASIPATIAMSVNVRSESNLVFGDENQIQQVLMNLCTNAAYAMREKGGVLEIELSHFSVSATKGNSHEMKPGLYMCLTVRDTGEGIAPEHVSRVFDPFFTTKNRGQGTGLGLSVAHGIVKQHDGYITFESQPGVGSLFTVYLPKASAQQPEETAVDEHVPTGRNGYFLLMMKKPCTEMGQEVLEELGYEVTVTNSSLEALVLFRADPSRYDLIVTDQTMPDMTGIQLTKEALALRPAIPIVLCTGFSHAVDAESAKAAGVKAFATKPLTKKEIAYTIRKVLDQ